MIERFLKQTKFTSEQDFKEHLEFIIADIFTDKIMHILLFLPLRQLLSRANQLLNSGSHSLLMFANLLFIKKILRNKNQIRRVFDIHCG